MKYKKPVLFTVFLLLTACHTKDIERVDISKAENLKATIYPEFQNLLCCNDIILDQYMLVINDWCSDSGFFHVYKYNPVEKLFSFANKGRGPGEFLSPFYFNNIIPPSDKLRFSVYDLNLKKSAKYKIEEKYSVSQQSIPEEIFPSLNLTYHDSCFYGRDLSFKEGLFFIYDLKTRQKRWADLLPSDFYRKNQSRNLSLVFINNEVVNAEKGKIAVGMNYFNQVHFYDLNGDHIKSVSIGKDIQPLLNENDVITDNSYYYCLDIYGTDDYVYVLWAGQKASDYNANTVKYSFVLVFKWDGTHVKTYRILNSSHIGINPGNTVLFASGISSDGTTEISSYVLEH